MAKKNDDTAAAPSSDAFLAAIKATAKSNKGVNFAFGDEIMDHAREENRISFGNLALDDVTCGGLIRGQVCHIYGEDNAGKTLQAHLTAKYVQQVLGGNVMWVAAKLETYDRNLAENVVGVDFSSKFTPVYVVEGEDDESVLNASVDMVRTGTVDLMVVDSYGAIRAKAGMKKDVGERRQIGDHASLLQDFLGKWASASIAGGRRTAVLALNQQRATFGQDFKGNPLPPHPACAHAVMHADALRIRMQKGRNLPEDNPDQEFPVGRTTRYSGEKAKISGPHGRKGTANIYVRDCDATDNVAGTVDNTAILVELAKREGLVDTTGSWHSIMGAPRVNGDPALAKLLRDDTDLYTAVYAEVRKTWFHKKEAA